jgi:hypothetical protein
MKLQNAPHSESNETVQFQSRRRFTGRSLFAGVTLLAIVFCAAPRAHAQQKSAQFVVPTLLSKGIDSKKSQTGEPVEFRVSAPVRLPDGTQISKGSKVVGHVVASKARAKGDSDSTLQIAVDKINLSDGKTLAISGILQAVGPDPASGGGGGGVDYGGLRQTVEHSSPGDQSQPVTILDAQSTGVHGIKNLQLHQDGVLASDGKSVKVDFNSQVIVQAQLAAGN